MMTTKNTAYYGFNNSQNIFARVKKKW